MTDANRDHGSHDDDAGFASTGEAESRLADEDQLAQEGDPEEAAGTETGADTAEREVEAGGAG